MEFIWAIWQLVTSSWYKHCSCKWLDLFSTWELSSEKLIKLESTWKICSLCSNKNLLSQKKQTQKILNTKVEGLRSKSSALNIISQLLTATKINQNSNKSFCFKILISTSNQEQLTPSSAKVDSVKQLFLVYYSECMTLKKEESSSTGKIWKISSLILSENTLV